MIYFKMEKIGNSTHNKEKKTRSENLVFNTIPAANKLALKLVKINNQETIKSRYYHTLVSIEI